MKKNRLIRILLMLCFCVMMLVPVQAKAATTKITYKGKTYTYDRRSNYVYVNNKKKSISSQPTFMMSKCYMGSITPVFKNSDLGVKVKTSTTKLTLTYKDKKLVMTDGKKTAKLNGKSVSFDAKVMKAVYKHSKYKRWILPLHDVCAVLGIYYKAVNQVVHIGGTTEAPADPSKDTDSTSDKEETVVIKPDTPDQTVNGRALVLCLDAGHGGSDSGAVGKKYLEKNLTLAILKAAKKYFDGDQRFKVYYTRTTDSFPSLDDRYKLANAKKADLFISIHINSAPTKTATGTETLFNLGRNTLTKKNGVTSYDLAKHLLEDTVASTGFRRRETVDRRDLRILNNSDMPSCIIEYGFISTEAEEISMYNNTSKYGKDLYESVVSFCTKKKLFSLK